MIIGIPREIMDGEFRVSLPPAGVATLVKAGHKVLVEKGAGEGSGFTDDDFINAGAEIRATPSEIFAGAEMVVKVKEPLSTEYDFLREGLLLKTFLHLAPRRDLTKELMRRKVTAIAYETVQLSDGSLPILTPMSEVAGRMAIQVAAYYLEKGNGGCGKLLGGVPGVPPAKVVILGGGTVGINAAQVALGMGAQVTIINRGLERLRYLGQVLHGNLITMSSNPHNIALAVKDADVVIGATLTIGGRAPILVTRETVESMRPGSVVIDVSVDQGGCFETCRPTTHSQPTYLVNGVLHYCVANMPGAVPQTSTLALSNATLPYILKLANLGFVRAVKEDLALAKGVNIYKGFITHQAVAEAQGEAYKPLEKLV